MARSRRGGPSGLLSGKLGDVIFSITRNLDGSLRQQISANPVTRENPNTFEQARARCTMATIERAMFTFADFVSTGWEGVPPGTLSVSRFSEVNYNYLADFLKVMFDDDSDYDVHWDLPKKGQASPRDGDFILSQGSLKRTSNWITGWGGLDSPYWFVQSKPYSGDGRLGDWLQVNGLAPGDQWVFVWFVQGRTPSKSMVQWVLVAAEINAPVNTEITTQNFRQLLTLKSNVPLNVTFNNQYKRLKFEFLQGANYDLKRCTSYAERFRRSQAGKILYNNCELFCLSDDPVSDFGWQGMREVRPSWLNE